MIGHVLFLQQNRFSASRTQSLVMPPFPIVWGLFMLHVPCDVVEVCDAAPRFSGFALAFGSQCVRFDLSAQKATVS